APERQARALLEPNAEGEGPRQAIVATLGAGGALAVARDPSASGGIAVSAFPAIAVQPVDATGAGDAFNGALAASLLEGRDLADPARRAVVAAGPAPRRAGAREGMPSLAALESALEAVGMRLG